MKIQSLPMAPYFQWIYDNFKDIKHVFGMHVSCGTPIYEY